jgi:hypothetical protein
LRRVLIKCNSDRHLTVGWQKMQLNLKWLVRTHSE